jgi:hypothetical protein
MSASDTSTDRIRALNDNFRRDFRQGHAVITLGIAALGPEAVARSVVSPNSFKFIVSSLSRLLAPEAMGFNNDLTTE